MSAAEEALEKIKLAHKTKGFLLRMGLQKREELLRSVSESLCSHYDSIVEANEKDRELSLQKKLSPTLIDRLKLPSVAVVEKIFLDALRVPDLFSEPIREERNKTIDFVLSGTKQRFKRIATYRVPLGVIGQIYESRPLATLVAVPMALKTANSLILKGGREALETNLAVVRIVKEVLRQRGCPEALCELIMDDASYSASQVLIGSRGLVDAVVVRGGARTIGSLRDKAKVPILITGDGVVHAYVHSSANQELAIESIVFSKLRGTTWCSCVDTVLVDDAISIQFLARLSQACQHAGIEILGCSRSREILTGIPLVPEDGWDHEYLSLKIGVRIVKDYEQAFSHMQNHTTGHTDSVFCSDEKIKETFTSFLDTGALIFNAPTILNGGFLFGTGFPFNFGISTEKLHVRGVMGLESLTTTKYVADAENE